MNDADGHRIEAAEQFGFQPIDTDGREDYIATEAQLLMFAKACERAGRQQVIDMIVGSALRYARPDALAILQRELEQRNAATDAELMPILEAERVRSLTADGYVRGADGQWAKACTYCDNRNPCENCMNTGVEQP